MKDKILLFDLDDTLIDTRYRHYSVFRDFVEITKQVPCKLSFEEYCSMRRTHHLTNLEMLLNVDGCSDYVSQFGEFWLNNIESQAYLKLDTLLIARDKLDSLKEASGYKFGILSLRANPNNARKQLAQLGVAGCFDVTEFIQHSKSINPKIAMLYSISEKFDVVAFIGDSRTDQEAAQHAGVFFCAVNTSMYNQFDNAKGISQVLTFLT